MRIPHKPFRSYKWRWAVLTPTESLNDPEVYFGVLRVLRKHEGKAPSDPSLETDLARVQYETGTSVNLVRSGERNLIRNSGQYWKNLDLLAKTKGLIELTPFGRKVADGDYSEVEFATSIIPNHQLPNPRVQTPEEVNEWQNAGLVIYPFKLILSILNEFKRRGHSQDAFITAKELLKIVIPLAGDKGSMDEYIEALTLFRNNPDKFGDWPDCGQASNDIRMVLEFLIFLTNYGYLNVDKANSKSRNEALYYLANIEIEEISELLKMKPDSPIQLMPVIRESGIPYEVERKKVARNITYRPNQDKFKRNIRTAYGGICLISQVGFVNVLQAAHIKPVEHNGNDRIENGILLRADLHILFDSGHLRIEPNGLVRLTETIQSEPKYPYHGMQLNIPDFVNRDYLDWRFKYWK